MNVFGFFAVLIICATAIAITCIVIYKPKKSDFKSKKPLKSQEIQKLTEESPIVTQKIGEKTVEEEINENIPQASMDAVIRSVNELMGVQTEEVDDENTREE